MRLSPQRSLAAITALTVSSLASAPARAASPAEDHVLPLSELKQQVTSSANTRTKNLEDIARVLSLPAAQAELGKVNINSGQVKTAIAQLNDQELQRLADRARAAEKDVQGGLIVGILALIGLIVVIIVVVTLVA